MFFLKKLVSLFLLPTTAALFLLAVGLVLLWLDRRVRLGKILVTCGFAVFALGTSDLVVDTVLKPLERRNPPLHPRPNLQAALAAAGPAPRFVVVLGGGETVDPSVPANDQLNDAALSRLVEGVRLLRAVPGTKLLLSGGVGHANDKHVDRLVAVATMLGVRPHELDTDRTGWDTEMEAVNLAKRLGREPFMLVTSAVHMPRALALFRHAGANPIPAPTQHHTLDVGGVTVRELFPSPEALAELEAGWHEYLGLLWSKLRGRL